MHLGRDQDKAVARYKQSQMYKHFESLKRSTLKGQRSSNSEDINLIGSIETVVERANAFREAGVTHFLGLFFAANSVSELLDQMQMFAEEVRPHSNDCFGTGTVSGGRASVHAIGRVPSDPLSSSRSIRRF